MKRQIARMIAMGAAVLLAGAAGAVSCDGTNVWIGAASGGSWSNAANWEAHSSKGYGVEELFHRYTVYDFRNLAPGAVVTMDYEDGNAYNVRNSTGDTFVYGMVFSGDPDDTWTLAKGTDKRIRFTNPSYMDITGGTLDFQAAIVTSASYPNTESGFHKRGTGTLRWGYSNAAFWESNLQLDAGTVELTNNNNFTCCGWKMKSGTKMNVLCGVNNLGSLYSDSTVSADTAVDIPAGTTLKLVTSFNTYSANFYGDVTGNGLLDVRGGGSFVFHKGAKTGPFSFAGTLRAWNADLTFGTASVPVGVNSAASVDVAASGHIKFTADQTLALLSGAGADGGIVVPSNATLTVAGATGVSTSTVFAARIQGGKFVKDGADYELTLAGANAYTGSTRVAGGTLTLDKGFARPNLCAAWRFEDENDLGAESTYGGALRLTPTIEGNASSLSDVVTLVDDGVSGRAIRFISNTSADRLRGAIFKQAASDRNGLLPAGNDPFTVSFWLRPNVSGMPNGSAGPNFLRIWSGSWTAGQGVSFRGRYGFRYLYMCTDSGWTYSAPLTSNLVAQADFGSSAYLGDGKWHHVVGTYSNQTFHLYVDGVWRARADLGRDMNLPANISVQLGVCSATDTNHKFAGDVDEIQVFKGAWTADEVEAEYVARKPQEDFTVPEATAHWTFDEESEDHLFKDSGPHGWDLVNIASTGGVYASVQSMTYPENLGGKFLNLTSSADSPYLRLKDGAMPTNQMPKGISFTIMARFYRPANGLVLIVGDGTSSGSVRFGFNGVPRYMQVYPCGSTAYTFPETSLYNADSASPANWTQVAITYDASSKHTRYYVDGVETGRGSGTERKLNLTGVWCGVKSVSNGTVTPLGYARIDDLRIYDRALTAGEMHRLAQTYRQTDAGLAVPTEVLPSTSDVTVDAGATLKVRETAHAVKSLAGAGTAQIEGSAMLVPGSMAGFTGTVTGHGVLRLAGGASAKTAASVTTDVEIPSVVTDVAGSNLPLVRTTGKVTMPATATIDFSDAARAGEVQGKVYVLAEAGSFDVPETLEGWTITPALAEGQGEPKLVVEDGKLKLKLGIQPVVIIIR